MAAPSVRRRLILSFVAILALFAINQAIGIWSDRVRSQSMEALNHALTRRVMTASVRQQLADLHKEITLLADVRLEPGSLPDPAVSKGFESKLALAALDVHELRMLTGSQDSVDTAALEDCFVQVAGLWKKFFEYLAVEPAWSVAALASADPLTQRLLGEIVPRLEAEGNQAAATARADFESVSSRIRVVALVTFVISVIIGIAVALRLSTYLVRRLADLRHGADIIGEVNLQHRITVEPRDEMGELAESFNEMAANLDAAQMRLRGANDQLAELNRLLSHRIEDELAKVWVAARIQRDLLPKRPPEISGYALAGRSIAAQTVGGDYFDFIPMDDDLVLCVADVSGKGLPASLLMANLQAAVRSQVLAHASVTECLHRTNTLLFRSTDPGKFVTAFYGVLDHQRHLLTYSNAGHNPPLLFRDGMEPERLEAGGLVLGIFEDVQFEEATCRFDRGDLLVIYSDGISEARDANDEEFGEEGIIAVVNREQQRGPAEVLDAIVKAALDFSGDQLQLDDMTIIVVQRS